MNKAVLKEICRESEIWKGACPWPVGRRAAIFQCCICTFLKVPTEEADILSKLLAEVASASAMQNVFQEPAAAKVSGGILGCTVWWGNLNLEV